MDRHDWEWVLTCFGTAVGAGILFLPIRAGLGGIWPTLLLTAIIFPVTYVAHRGVTRIVASCPRPTDIVGAVEQDMGRNVSFAVSVLYFMSIITICVGYATGMTNIVQSFLENQMGMPPSSRSGLTFIILFIVTGVILCGEKTMVRITSIITFPLIILLATLSFYMIPHWNMAMLDQPFRLNDTLKNFFLLFPILVFAMNFSPVCSTLGAAYRTRFPEGDEAVKRSDVVVRWTSFILLVFVMFFVLSLMLSSTPEMLQAAERNNVDMLTAMSLAFDQPVLMYLNPLIAILAIVSSYFGHFVGTREGLIGIIVRLICWKNPEKSKTMQTKSLTLAMTAALMLGLWFLAVHNPPVLKIIGALSSPIIAVYAYLMPVILMRRVPRLIIYRSRLAGFIFIMGIVGIVGEFTGTYLMD